VDRKWSAHGQNDEFDPKATSAAPSDNDYPCSPLSNKQETAMSIIIRVVILATFAYAGSIVAGVQFPDLPDPYQTAQK
jgi:hypothetical protein